MWVIALALLSLTATALWYKMRPRNEYRLDLLALISGSAATMFLVDSIYSYFEEGVFIEISSDSVLLSVVLTLSAVLLWLIVLVAKRLTR